MTFDLFFPKLGNGPNDENAKTAFWDPVCYVSVLETTDPAWVDRDGRILITYEALSAEECSRQIDALIQDLTRLKGKAKREFDRRRSETPEVSNT